MWKLGQLGDLYSGMALPAVMLVVFLVSTVISLIAAERLTHVDVRGRHPERSRHWSASGIPRIGGIAVFASAPLAIIAVGLARRAIYGAALNLPELALSLILGAAILFTIGLLDDLRGVRPLTKLIAQTAAALFVCGAGFSISDVSLFPGHVLHLGALALPVTIIWLVGISNAFNLVD